MDFVFQSMDEVSARMILNWRYEPPYDYYNPDPYDGKPFILMIRIKQYDWQPVLQ